MQLKTFTVNSGGAIKGLAERIEKEGNIFLSKNPGLHVRNIFVVPTSSGLSVVGILYENEEKTEKEEKTSEVK